LVVEQPDGFGRRFAAIQRNVQNTFVYSLGIGKIDLVWGLVPAVGHGEIFPSLGHTGIKLEFIN